MEKQNGLVLFCLLLLFMNSSTIASFTLNPKANPKAIVRVGKHARFTILTSELIRMEFAPNDDFQDHASLIITNRFFKEVPSFNVETRDAWTIITTDKIELAYLSKNTQSFDDENLQVRLLENPKRFKEKGVWKPSMTDASHQDAMPGTIRTLDTINGSAQLDCLQAGPAYNQDLHCAYGLFSQDRGYFVLDDSIGPRLDNDPSFQWLQPQENRSTPTIEQCLAVPIEKRRVCGMEIVSESVCRSLGCCFTPDAFHSGGFQCFYSSVSSQDLYFFGHGLNFKQALKDFTLVAGKIPIPPRFAFGVFYSRWWGFSDADLKKEVVQQYETHGLPLDVLVIDMDWHLTFYKDTTPDQAGQPKGWTGFTWDKHLFPDPKAFLRWLHGKGIATTLNLHPASGVQPWEESYQEMAEAMGIDPATGAYVPFQVTDKCFMTNWLNRSIGVREREGVDFWWLDWQQGEEWIEIKEGGRGDVSMTLWLNHVFSKNPFHWKHPENDLSGVNGNKKELRPMILHRWGGIGNHRYQVGFSGDVVASWESLKFQPFFTKMAANVGFGYWSHDLGGFQYPSEPELFTRWLQWGAFSPIFRTHSSKDSKSDRRIWKYPDEYYEITSAAMKLRSSFIPYIYTQAKRTHDDGLSLVRGLYFDYPHIQEAYSFKEQYLFGDDLLVSPIITRLHNKTKLAKKSVWVPEGEWYDFTRGAIISGPIILSSSYTLDEIPLFARVGSIIPMSAEDVGISSVGQARKVPAKLKIFVVPGASKAKGWVYEDDGFSQQYLHEEYARTEFEFSSSCVKKQDVFPLGGVDKSVCSRGSSTILIHQVKGGFKGMLQHRKYVIELPASLPADYVEVNGKEVAFSPVPIDSNYWGYNAQKFTLQVHLNTFYSVQKPLEIKIVSINTSPVRNPSRLLFGDIVGKFSRLHAVKRILDNQWGIDTVYMTDYPSLLLASETDERIGYHPERIIQELDYFDGNLTEAVKELKALPHLVEHIKEQALAYLTSPTFETETLQYPVAVE